MNNSNQDNNLQENIDPPEAPCETGAAAPKRLNWGYAAVGTFMLVALIIGTFLLLNRSSEFSFSELPQMLRRASAPFLALGFFFLFLHVYCEGRAMASAAAAIGIKVGHFKSTLYAASELFFAAVTPSASGGQPAVAYFMYKDGIKLSKSTVILLNNTLHSTTSLLALGVATLVFRHGLIAAESAKHTSFEILFILGFVANILGLLSCLLFIFAPGLVRTLGVPVYRFLARIRVIKDLDNKLESFEAAIKDYGECQRMIRRSPLAQLKIFLWNVAQRCAVCAVSYCVYRALGYDSASLADILFIQFIIIFTCNALPLPGSAGASELITRQLYVGLYGAELAVPAMLFSRSISFYSLVVVCGVITLVYYFSVRGRRSKNGGAE